MYTNRFMMFLVTGSWATINLGLLYAGNYKWMRAMEFTAADWASFAIVNLCMFAFTAFVTQSTRSSVREQFLIREERCYDLEDVLCATTCLPCTVAQMARHTANYDNYEAVCCSKTGLPDGVSVKHSSADMKENSQYLV
jgi:Cys-rich protein (TIGR01571 family)